MSTDPTPDKRWHITVFSPARVKLAPRDEATVLCLDEQIPLQSAPIVLEPWFGPHPGCTDLLRLCVPAAPNDLCPTIAEFWLTNAKFHTNLDAYGSAQGHGVTTNQLAEESRERRDR